MRKWSMSMCALLLLAAAVPARAQSVSCLLDGILTPPAVWPDYSSSGVALAPHCYGTNQQRIDALDRVVFLGDSITVGTPPTATDDYYRNRLADALVAAYGLTAPLFLWRAVNIFDGTTTIQESGDFASCAEWGARADDLLVNSPQLLDCFPNPVHTERTLVVMTIGGNDLVSLADDAEAGASPAQLEATRDAVLQDIADALDWLQSPGRFPNGVWIVLANIYDPTDGLNVFPGVCGLAGPPALTAIEGLVIETQEALLDIAVARGVDLVFMREHFCGHGLNAADPTAPCYRGPGAAAWLDLTCIHPSPAGHAAIADDFLQTILAIPPVTPIPLLPYALDGGANHRGSARDRVEPAP